MSNSELISKFYKAFANGDTRTMAECYHENIIFEDPAFGQLQDERAKKCGRCCFQERKVNSK